MNKQKSILLFVICIMLFAVSGVSADFTDDFSDENYAANGWNSAPCRTARSMTDS